MTILPWPAVGTFVADIRSYGAKWDGVTDDTAALNNAIADIAVHGGGTIELPGGSGVIAGQIAIPFLNEAGFPRAAASLRIVGQGADTQQAAAGGVPTSGTVVHMTYNSATGNQCKIDARGRGKLTLAHMTLIDDSPAAATIGTPFVHTTFTVLHAHDLFVCGSPSLGGVANIQDAFIMGGTATVTDTAFNAPYQGYGSVIENCWFDHLRRAVLGQTYCNGLRVINNTIWQNCGSNLAGGAAIEIAGDATGTADSVGCTIGPNYIETPSYVYPVKLSHATNNLIIGNDMEDFNARTLSFVRFDVNAYYNLLIGSYGNTATPLASEDASVVGKNTWLDYRQSQTSQWTEIHNYKGHLVVQNNGNTPFGPELQNTAGDRLYWSMVSNAALKLTQNLFGGSGVDLMTLSLVSGNIGRLTFNGTSFNQIISGAGGLYLEAAAHSPVVIGDALAQHWTCTDGVLASNTTGGAALKLNSGASHYSGSGAPVLPAGAASVNAGDWYWRTDTPTVANQRAYICTVGGATPTWVGVL